MPPATPTLPFTISSIPIAEGGQVAGRLLGQALKESRARRRNTRFAGARADAMSDAPPRAVRPVRRAPAFPNGNGRRHRLGGARAGAARVAGAAGRGLGARR